MDKHFPYAIVVRGRQILLMRNSGMCTAYDITVRYGFSFSLGKPIFQDLPDYQLMQDS